MRIVMWLPSCRMVYCIRYFANSGLKLFALYGVVYVLVFIHKCGYSMSCMVNVIWNFSANLLDSSKSCLANC